MLDNSQTGQCRFAKQKALPKLKYTLKLEKIPDFKKENIQSDTTKYLTKYSIPTLIL